MTGFEYVKYALQGMLTIGSAYMIIYIGEAQGYDLTSMTLCVIFFASILIAILGVWLIFRFAQSMVVILFGVLLGAQIGFLAHTMFVALFNFGTMWTLLLTCLVTMVIFGILTHKFRHEMMVFAIAFTSIFLIMQGIATIAGGFPTVFEMMHDLSTQNVEPDLTIYFWVYWAVFGMGTVFFTGYHLRKEKHLKEFLAVQND